MHLWGDDSPFTTMLLVKFKQTLYFFGIHHFLRNFLIEMMQPSSLKKKYLSLHCFPVRLISNFDNIVFAICVHFFFPCLWTWSIMKRSSFLNHSPLVIFWFRFILEESEVFWMLQIFFEPLGMLDFDKVYNITGQF